MNKKRLSGIMMLTLLSTNLLLSPVVLAMENSTITVRDSSTITTEPHTYFGEDGKPQGTSTITYPKEMKVGEESVITIKYTFDPTAAQDAWGNFQGEQMTIGDSSDAKFTTITGFPRGDATVKSDKKIAFIDLLYAEDGVKEYKMSVMPNASGTFELKGSLNYAQGEPTTSNDSFESPFNISIPIVEDNKQSITGSDFSMYVGDKTPTASDFKASATDKDGKASEVTVDLSKADLTKAGTYDVTLKSADGQSKVVKLTVKANPVPNKKLGVYRAYNPNSGEHLYTTSVYEYKYVILKGWKAEGLRWFSPVTGTPVYRAYNPNSGEHFYTISLYEYNQVTSKGWRKEGIGFYTDPNKGVPIYRNFNPNATGPGSHLYTQSNYEYNYLGKIGWRKEGIAFYGMK